MKMKHKPSIKQNPSNSFKGTGGAVSGEYNIYTHVYYSVFMCYIHAEPLTASSTEPGLNNYQPLVDEWIEGEQPLDLK